VEKRGGVSFIPPKKKPHKTVVATGDLEERGEGERKAHVFTSILISIVHICQEQERKKTKSSSAARKGKGKRGGGPLSLLFHLTGGEKKKTGQRRQRHSQITRGTKKRKGEEEGERTHRGHFRYSLLSSYPFAYSPGKTKERKNSTQEKERGQFIPILQPKRGEENGHAVVLGRPVQTERGGKGEVRRKKSSTDGRCKKKKKKRGGKRSSLALRVCPV